MDKTTNNLMNSAEILINGAMVIRARGRFVDECKNRFLCKVNLPELGLMQCYVSSSARLTNLINLKDRIVCLSELPNGKCSKYSLLAREDGRYYTLLNLNLVNNLICAALKSEKRYNAVNMQINKLTSFGYRSDISACFKNIEYFEIKSLLSDDKIAKFPAILGERAFRQLEQISEELINNKRFTYIIALLNSKIKAVTLCEENSEYNQLIKKCFARGMKIRIYRLNWVIGDTPGFLRARKAEQAFISQLQEVSA